VSNAAKRRAIVDKLSADIARLLKEIEDRRVHLAQVRARALAKPHKGKLIAGWFDAWSRHAPPIARAEGSLRRALSRAAVATEKAEDAATQEREQTRQRAAIRARNVGLMRRLDALREEAPAIKQRWAAERREEEKRLKKLKKRLQDRTRKDLSARPDWMKKPVALPPPIAQPDLTAEDPADLSPPREGLIPGTYRLIDPARLDPARLSFSLLDDEPLPPAWNARHVGRRLIEAHDVLRRLPMNVRPQGYSALWPEYQHTAGELAIQAGAQTLAIGRNAIIKTASSDEVARMNEALGWPIQFLAHANFWALSALNNWASNRDATPDDPDAPDDMLKFIAEALNAAREPVK
jgi:hypothetical protein